MEKLNTNKEKNTLRLGRMLLMLEVLHLGLDQVAIDLKSIWRKVERVKGSEARFDMKETCKQLHLYLRTQLRYHQIL